VSTNPLDAYRKHDPKLIVCYDNLQKLTLSEGALSQKIKLLVTLAIDAEHGALQGATSLAQRAVKLGATRDEIVEALRIAYYVGGNRALFTAATVLQTVFK
jgi:alkylhydroperoxidase/carboxymuconolactone decarboxylase family protein YurZ